jgi:hypothetical protein
MELLMDVLKMLGSDTRMAAALAVQVVLLAIIVAYIWKFRKAGRLFESFQRQWTAAAADHKTLLTEAQERVNSLTAPRPETLVFQTRRPQLISDARNHVVAMAKKGASPDEIARTCGLPENAVHVMLGFARLQETRKA